MSDGSQIRAYRNLTNGNLDLSPYTFSITATKIIVAQMDESIYNVNQFTRFDLVSYSGSQVSIRLNNNNNGFSSTQTFDVGFGITGIAVGDVDNNGLNDVVVGGSDIVKAYINNGGTINTTATWSATNFYFSVVPLIGDMGTPTDPNRNDGWNDIVVTGYSTPVMIFANHQGSFNSTPEQSFQSGAAMSGSSKAMLVDIQNTGGLSFVYHEVVSPIEGPSTHSIRTNKHTGDPAPAPPKGVQVVGTPPDEYGYRSPKITWARNTERDLSSYDLWRKKGGGMNCSNQGWTPIASSISSSTTEYTDWSISTVMSGGDCTAEYRLRAKDAANNLSDYSDTVAVNFASWFWKRHDGDGGSIQKKPQAYALHATYPNPFNPTTTIKYDLPEPTNVSLVVYDVLGRKVTELVNTTKEAGYHSATWNASEVASGVYFARFTATDGSGNVKLSKTGKLILNK